MSIDALIPIIHSLVKECQHRQVEVLTLGEEHSARKSREFISQALPHLARCGFTTYALELPIKTQSLFSVFEAGETTIDQLSNNLKPFKLWLYDEKGNGDYFYFNAIEAARKASMKLKAVDEGHVDGKFKNRDEHMFNQIMSLISENERVVLVGGFRHHYVRDAGNRGEFLTVNELLRDKMGGRVYSVLVKELEDYKGKGPVFIRTADEFGEQICLEESRCEHGPCVRRTGTGQEGCPIHGLSPIEPATTITYGAYDAAISP